MILQSIEAWELEKHLYPEAIRRGVDYLLQTDFSGLEAGRYEIDGDELFAMVQEVQTEPAERRKPESHRTYTDIQLLLSGEERIGVCKAAPGCEVGEDYPDRDLLFYSKVENETMLQMRPGMFAVLLPSDIHRPCCSSGADQPIRKVVVKIHGKLLGYL